MQHIYEMPPALLPRRLGRYKHSEVEAYVRSTRRLFLAMRGDLARLAARAGEVERRRAALDAEGAFISARVQAAEIVADARLEARELVEETRRRCQLALKTAIEKAAAAGYALSAEGGVAVVGTDDLPVTAIDDPQQQAFDAFFDDEKLDQRSRGWLNAS